MTISRATFQRAITAGLDAAGARLTSTERDALRRVGEQATAVGTNFSTGCVAVRAGLANRDGDYLAKNTLALADFILAYDGVLTSQPSLRPWPSDPITLEIR